jgi:hypothetical protein
MDQTFHGLPYCVVIPTYLPSLHLKSKIFPEFVQEGLSLRPNIEQSACLPEL